jgi:hypothetical protein
MWGHRAGYEGRMEYIAGWERGICCNSQLGTYLVHITSMRTSVAVGETGPRHQSAAAPLRFFVFDVARI